MSTTLFELLFKHPPSLFQAGDVRFQPSWALWVGTAAVLLVGLPLLLRYSRRPGGAKTRVLVALRLVVLLVVLVVLARPMLVVSTLVPLQSFVGVLVDDSASMEISDVGGSSRAVSALDVLGTPESGLLKDLEERFKVRLFSFSDDVLRIDSPQELAFGGEGTRLAGALEGAVDELATLPLAALVVITDGADNSGVSLDETLLDLESRSLPVMTVGFGEESFERDIEIARVESPRRVLRDSALVVEVTVEQRGFGGDSVTLEVEDDGRIVSTHEVEFPDAGEAVVARVNFQASEAGSREFNFRVPGQDGEILVRNNQRAASIQVDDRVEKVLYFEGEPRYELKFLRRAVHEDENLQLVVLQRSAENRFFRAALDDPTELEGGFPIRREDLFRYRGLILGSVEASFFTYDQLRMIADFVAVRGGGFLMIGGRNAFSEGGWAGTPVADVLPVVLGPANEDLAEPFFSRLDVELTDLGRTHPTTQLASTEEGSAEVWSQLPTVSTFNPVSQLKPGATSLLVGNGDGLDEQQIVLAYQRYGRGRALAWTVHDTWRWQMNHEIPLEDMSHERLWRQMLRWLVSYVPETVAVTSTTDHVGIGQTVELEAEVLDDGYLAVNNADVTAEITFPSGEIDSVPLRWTVEADGQYRGSFVAAEEGTYRVSYRAGSGDVAFGEGETFVEARSSDIEYFDAERRAALLERLADETGGRNYTPRDASDMVQDISVRGGGSMMVEHHELWDMPIVFIALLAILLTEWALRRRAGMA